MSIKAMTKADSDALNELPEGWFRPDHLPINRPAYRCERLEAREKLQRRIRGEWPNIFSEYKKIEGGEA